MPVSMKRGFLSVIFCLVLGGMLVACNGKNAGSKDSTVAGGTTMEKGGDQEQKNTELTRQFMEEVLNKGNMQFLDEHTADNFVEHNLIPGQPPGKEGMKKWLADWRAAFPDMHFTVDDIIAKGDLVVVRSTVTGTHKGPFMGAPPTNKPFKFEAIDIVRIVDGKQTEHWGQADAIGMMTQIGMIPEMGAPPPAGGGDTPAMKDSGMAKDTGMKK